jgi:uncharacterized protein (TIGR03435 family)
MVLKKLFVFGLFTYVVNVGAQSSTEPLGFEVASIKIAQPWTQAEAASGLSHRGLRITGSTVDVRWISLTHLIALAYQVDISQISGPDWLVHPKGFEIQMFDILAKMPPATSKEQVPAMLRQLLAERFALATHKESKTDEVYALSLAAGAHLQDALPVSNSSAPAPGRRYTSEYESSNGNKIRATSSETITIEEVSGPDIEMKIRGERFPGGMDHIEASKVTMRWLAQHLSALCDRRVVDMTGLSGHYRFTVDLPKVGTARSNPRASSISASLAKIGFKLDARKAPVDYLVIEHLLRDPTPN